MDRVHAAASELHTEGLVKITWKGEPRRVADGPYRIALVDAEADKLDP